LRSPQAARLPLAPPRDERVHDADGDALDDGGRGCGAALPVQLPPRLLGRRAAEPGGDPLVPRGVLRAGEPLNPEAIRWFRDQYGVTVLDYYGLTESYPLVANYPWME